MHPVIVVCIVAMVAGAAIALRWGHLDVVPPWTTGGDAGDRGDVDVGPPERLRRALWFAALYAYAAVVGGLLVLGPGGRLVMRLLAVTAEEQAQGRRTEADEIVGVITVDGTIGFVVFVGLFGGVILAALTLLLRKWLPPRRWGALCVGVVFAVLFSTRLEPLRRFNPDFVLVGPPWLAVSSFLAVGALTLLTMAAVAGRVSRLLPLVESRPAAIAPYGVLVVLTPTATVILPAVVLTAIGIALLQRPGFRRWWTSNPGVLRVGRVLIAATVLFYAPSFVDDIAYLLDEA